MSYLMKLSFRTSALIAAIGMSIAINASSCYYRHTVFLQHPEITINDTMQQIVAETMEDAVAFRKPDWACAILISKEGQVVALFETDSVQSHINQDIRVGGILKPFTILGALTTNLIDNTELMPITKKGFLMGECQIIDWHPMDTCLTISDIIAVSSNIGEIEILSKAYRNPDTLRFFNEYMQSVGINARVDSLSDLLCQVSQGNFRTSPLHLAWLYHCLAQNLLSEEWHDAATIVRDGLHNVVWNKIGTASRDTWILAAQSDKVHIMGKTGGVLINREQRNYTISFCGIFPEENPQYTCLVMYSNPSFPFSERLDCVVQVRKIAERIITQ